MEVLLPLVNGTYVNKQQKTPEQTRSEQDRRPEASVARRRRSTKQTTPEAISVNNENETRKRNGGKGREEEKTCIPGFSNHFSQAAVLASEAVIFSMVQDSESPAEGDEAGALSMTGTGFLGEERNLLKPPRPRVIPNTAMTTWTKKQGKKPSEIFSHEAQNKSKTRWQDLPCASWGSAC